MKRLGTTILALILFSAFNLNAAKYSYSYKISFNVFFNELNPHGDWIELEPGLLVFKPFNTSYDWAPYKYGNWICTNEGWYWNSYEPHAWATYHYGRWFHDSYYGWVWFPDYDWAPSWVEWRYDANYIGWAPLPPYAKYSNDFGIRFTVNWVTPQIHWHFVKMHNFGAVSVHNYYISSNNTASVYRKTKYRTNYRRNSSGRIVNSGIERSFIERNGNTRIANNTITYNTINRQGSVNNKTRTVSVYRPNGRRNTNTNIDTGNIKVSRKTSSIISDKVVTSRNSVTRGSSATRLSRKTNEVNRSGNTRTQSVARNNSNSRNNETSYRSNSGYGSRKVYSNRGELTKKTNKVYSNRSNRSTKINSTPVRKSTTRKVNSNNRNTSSGKSAGRSR